MHVFWNSPWKPSSALAGLLIYKSSSFESFPNKRGVGVKSVVFLDGTQVFYPGNVRFPSAVAQSHAKYFNSVERVRGMRNTSAMGTTKKSLAQTHPALAKEADGWDPNSVGAGSHKKLNWKCKDGHVWQNSVEMRTKRNQGCPYCSGKRIITGVNDLMTKSPEVAKQAFGWDPSIVSEFSGKKLDWKCEKGHVWNAGVHSRTGKSKTGCPYCSGRRPIKGETDLATTHPLLAKEALDLDATSVSAG
jgi:DNA-directed RNA polymerase subunit RPC12/RpoP